MNAVCPHCASQGVVGEQSKARKLTTAIGAVQGAVGGILSALSSSQAGRSGERAADAVWSALMGGAAGAAAGSAIGETLDNVPPDGIRCEVCGRHVEIAKLTR